MAELLSDVASLSTLFSVLLIFGFAPGFVLRIIVLLYPREDPRRRELVAELYSVRRRERPLWVAEQIEAALFEGVRERIKARVAAKQRDQLEAERDQLQAHIEAVFGSPSKYLTKSGQYAEVKVTTRHLEKSVDDFYQRGTAFASQIRRWDKERKALRRRTAPTDYNVPLLRRQEHPGREPNSSPNAHQIDPGRQLHVSASGTDAVLAYYVPSSGQVLLRPAKPDALAEELVAEFPDVAPGAGVALSVPETDLRRAVNVAPPRRDVRRVLDVAALPRNGRGQIHAGYRDGVHGYRTSGNNCCTFYDTDQGHYLYSFTEEPGYDRYVNVAQGRRETLVTKSNELLNQLRRPHRGL